MSYFGEIEDVPVLYHPVTGEIVEQNPIPARAREVKARTPYDAANSSGIGRVDWTQVEAWYRDPNDVMDFKREYSLGKLLAGNAKTVKPRPGGRKAVITGMALAPHYYPNFLNMVPSNEDGTLRPVNKVEFNRFNGTTPDSASKDSGIRKKDLLTFCTHSSSYCRSTCLVITGQNPSTQDAANSKMKMTNAFLEEPELFVALLYRQLLSFAKARSEEGYEPVVRLNMLSDLPWYVMCPELLLALEGYVTFYDYTKVPYWDNPEYQDVAHLLDLTFSFAGNNERQCRDALDAGERIAVCFAPSDPERRATPKMRTTFQEIVASGLVDRDGRINLFGGAWELVDGDDSDFRIDDPKQSIVSLNFKEPNLAEKTYGPSIAERTRMSRAHFAKPVPDAEGRGARYRDARARDRWRKLGINVAGIPADEVISLIESRASDEEFLAVARKYDALKVPDAKRNPRPVTDGLMDAVGDLAERYSDAGDEENADLGRAIYNELWEGDAETDQEARNYVADGRALVRPNPEWTPDPSEPMTARTTIPMFPIAGTDLMIGPHVPTVLND